MNNKKKALFLDRDGVINKEINYLHRIEDFEFNNGIFEICKYFLSKDFIIIVITNQAGIARGYYKEEDLISLTEWMVGKFLERNIHIHKVYYCPHHPDYTGMCECRKPNPGMIKKAEIEFNIDLNESVLIGDRISDIEAGINAGVGNSIFVHTDKLNNSFLGYIIQNDL
jgi:D-glycero-D-manno-heptose 1,7-bisphosphate phosphatase